MSRFKKVAVAICLVGALFMAAAGCIVHTSEPTLATSYYTPMYYNGYVVYYDTLGRPIYYVNGIQYYVPATYYNYHAYVRHWRVHRVYYNRWYRTRGHRYRRYRRHHRRAARRHHRRAVRRHHRRHR